MTKLFAETEILQTYLLRQCYYIRQDGTLQMDKVTLYIKHDKTVSPHYHMGFQVARGPSSLLPNVSAAIP